MGTSALVLTHPRQGMAVLTTSLLEPLRGSRLSTIHTASVHRAARVTGRTSAVLFAAAQFSQALRLPSAGAWRPLYLGFVAAHAVHFTAVTRYAAMTNGRNLFPGGRDMNDVGGWPTWSASTHSSSPSPPLRGPAQVAPAGSAPASAERLRRHSAPRRHVRLLLPRPDTAYPLERPPGNDHRCRRFRPHRSSATTAASMLHLRLCTVSAAAKGAVERLAAAGVRHRGSDLGSRARRARCGRTRRHLPRFHRSKASKSPVAAPNLHGTDDDL